MLSDYTYEMSTIQSFKDLVVWKESISLAKMVNSHIIQLPDYEQYNLSSQMRRSATSISSNIAEGRGRGSRKDFIRFLNIGIGSLSELESQIILTGKLYDLKNEKLNEQIILVRKLLYGMKRKLKAKT
jgi:four helix bundle protein